MPSGQIDSRDYKAAAKALREAGDKELKREYSRALRGVARPFGRAVAQAAGDRLPQRGGLGARVAAARVGVQVSGLRVTVSLKTKQGDNLAAVRRGRIRHPVYGNPRTWAAQDVDGRGFQQGFDANVEQVRQAAVDAGQRVLDKIAGATR